jgi:hypothetical protein
LSEAQKPGVYRVDIMTALKQKIIKLHGIINTSHWVKSAGADRFSSSRNPKTSSPQQNEEIMNRLASYFHGLFKRFRSIKAGNRITNLPVWYLTPTIPLLRKPWTRAVITTLPILAMRNAPGAKRRCAFSGDCRVVGHMCQHMSQMFIE